MIVFVNGQERDVSASTTLAAVLGLDGGTPRGVAVALDGVVVPRAQHAGTVLRHGARVEVVTAVQGG